MAARKPNPALEYARAVTRGDIVAGELVRLAGQRHLDDLDTAKERGLWFDVDAGNRAIDFLELCHHFEGEWASGGCMCDEGDKGFDLCPTRLRLELWQKFYIASIFGWKLSVEGEYVRRFSTSYLQVARKNGKTLKLAGIGLKLMLADEEPGAQVWSAATKEEQARIVLGAAARFVDSSPELRAVASMSGSFKKVTSVWSNDEIGSFRPFGRDSKSEDGWNPHGALIDEYHAHPDNDLLGVIETGMGARRQPMIAIITTAGKTLDANPCKELRDHGERVLHGDAKDDRTFFLIYEIDAEDDWKDPNTFIKCNPNVGVSVKVSRLLEMIERAEGLPSREREIRTKNFNQWIEDAQAWLPMDAWKECGKLPFNLSDHHGRKCFGAYDLSATRDLTAWAKVFPPDEDFPLWYSVVDFFLPREILKSRYRRDRSVTDWARRGLISLTQGDVVDYAAVRAKIHDDAATYQLEEIGFDPWNATQVSSDLTSDGFTLTSMAQTSKVFSPACKMFERLVAQKRWAHGADPVLTWNARNTIVYSDPNDNIKPDKRRSAERIDGIVAILMALHRAISHTASPPSIYEKRGPIVGPKPT